VLFRSVRIMSGSVILDSMLSDGTEIGEGAVVERSVISPGVYIGPNAVVRDSIILTDTAIEGGASVERCIVDKQVNIGHNARVGRVDDTAKDHGLTAIGKNADIPAEAIIGCNALIGTDTKRKHILDKYPDGKVPDGARINYKGPDKG
jgi:glucose-1-phosphate adenylyltransferase